LQVNTPGPVEFVNPRLSLATGTAAALPINPASITGLAVNEYNQPVSYQYSFGVQRQVNAKSVLAISYVGNQNRLQNDQREINLPNQSALIPIINGVAGANYNTAPGLPYPGFHSINLSTNEANSHYNALQVDLNSQLGRDLTFRAYYALSRSIDSAGQGGNGPGGDLQNVSDPYLGWKYDVGPGGYDVTHNAAFNFIYDIPLLRNSESRLLKSTIGGWQVSGIVTISSGLPLNIGLTGGQGGNGLPNATNRPNLTGSVSYPSTVGEWFSTSVFTDPAVGAFGNLGHNAVRGPGRDNWNLALFKSFVFSEERGSRFELRLESFNTWNHTEFQNVSTNLGASNFGQVTSAADPRIIQLGGKIYW